MVCNHPVTYSIPELNFNFPFCFKVQRDHCNILYLPPFQYLFPATCYSDVQSVFGPMLNYLLLVLLIVYGLINMLQNYIAPTAYL